MKKPKILTAKLTGKRFATQNSGIAAVEFALIAPILLGLILVIMESGWLMVRISLLDNAVEQVGREVYIGSAKLDTSVTQDSLKDALCSNLSVIKECKENISLEVRTITDFASIPTDAATCRDKADGPLAPLATYTPGAGSQVSFVRVCLTTDILTPFIGIGMNLPKSANGRYQMISTTAFLNEPF